MSPPKWAFFIKNECTICDFSTYRTKNMKTLPSNYNEEYGEYKEQGIPSPYSEQYGDYLSATDNQIISPVMKNRGSK